MPQQSRPLIGAIRWDAWHGDRSTPGIAVQKALGPAKYHWRLPFFATVRGDDDVVIDGTDQTVMDQEIEFASVAGIDYWAFVTYNENDAMSLGLKRYLSSPQRAGINFSLIIEASRLFNPEFTAWIIRLMQEPGYQTVLQNRPLLYLGFIDEAAVEKQYGNLQAFRQTVDDLRATLRTKGLADPYLVIMDFDPAQGKKWIELLDGNAISSYATTYAPEEATPYTRLAQADVQLWEACRASGMSVVPIVTSGWDRRPRIERPMPWETWQQPGVGLDCYTTAATPQELADHLKTALDWMAQHPATTPAQASLIYAWNENDEGGWIVPTHQDGPARLTAIAAMLKTHRR